MGPEAHDLRRKTTVPHPTLQDWQQKKTCSNRLGDHFFVSLRGSYGLCVGATRESTKFRS